MKWASAIYEGEPSPASFEKIREEIVSAMEGHPIDLAFLFVSPYSDKGCDAAIAALYRALDCHTLIGCLAGGLIGGNKELERYPGISLVTAHMPGVTCIPFHLRNDDLPDMDASPKLWQEKLKADAGQDPQFVLLGDPLSFDMEKGLMGLDFAYPKATKVGGLASSGGRQNSLFVNDHIYVSGMIGVALSGNLRIATLVAQGCRPIGTPLSITRCDRNLLIEVDHKPPMVIIQELFEACHEADRELMQHALFLGLAMTPFKEAPAHGDFLIRNLVGIDPKTGHIAVGAYLREGQTLQFHLRDAKTSSEDLQWLLTQYQLEERPDTAQGALLFSCLGRGEHLFGVPNHDSQLFQSYFGPIPLGGFFCNGEIGAVGGSTFLHGYTSCFGIFQEKGGAVASS